MKKLFTISSITIGCLFVATTSQAMPILTGSYSDSTYTWSATDSEERSAEAEIVYDSSTSTFSIILRSLAAETSQPNEVLAGIFFGFNGDFAITGPHVEVSVGSTLYQDGTATTTVTNLDGEFAFRSDIDAINGGLGDYGISSTGFDPEFPNAPVGWDGFGTEYIIDNNQELGGSKSVGGASFGIVNGDVTELPASVAVGYIANSVTMSFDYTGTYSGLSELSFLYGTDYDVAPVPEPATMLLMGTGLVGLAGLRRKKKK